MHFYKIQALGNDFVIFGNPDDNTLPTKEYISFICNRHFGIGADCAVYIGKSENHDYFMHVFNPDGFEAEICGNALRCSAKYIHEMDFFDKSSYNVETKAGAHTVYVNGEFITAEIGKPQVLHSGNIEISGVSLPYVAVSVGNPHCVVLMSYGIGDDEFKHFGSAIEHHHLFPEGTNVEFMCPTDDSRIVMRVWERGIGETLSCSTGSCACVAAAYHQGIKKEKMLVYQPGGVIEVNTRQCGNMFITGKCDIVFKGEINLK